MLICIGLYGEAKVTCDRCGRSTPVHDNPFEAIRFANKEGWETNIRNGKWHNHCLNCQWGWDTLHPKCREGES